MDEPCSALDPIATAKIEELIHELKKDLTIVIVTHNMQQAARVSEWTGFFLLGELVEFGATKELFTESAREADRGLHHRPVRIATARPPIAAARRGPKEAIMQRHFHEELEALKQTLLAMGGLVEDQIRRVMRALTERDDALAQEVIDRDRQVNAYDVEVDETCVNLLALHQPAAGDLRFITTAMKIVTDLERIGDQAVNIAQRALELNASRSSSRTSTFRGWPSARRRWSRTAWTPSSRATPSRRAACAAPMRRWTPSRSRSSASCSPS